MRGMHAIRPQDDPEFLELRRFFLREAAAMTREMADLLAGGAPEPGGERGLRFRKLAHDLRGSGGSYGFPIVTIHAGEAEDTHLEGGSPEALRAIVGMLEGSVRQAEALLGGPEPPPGGRAGNGGARVTIPPAGPEVR